MIAERQCSDLNAPVILWFRDDLRLADNPALHAAAKSGRRIMCIFVHDAESDGVRPTGGAARWWLHSGLRALDGGLRAQGGGLFLHRGSAANIVPQLAIKYGASAVYWNRRYGAAERRIDETVKDALATTGIAAHSFNGSLLYEPWEVQTKAGGPYRVFSAFWRAAYALGEPPSPLNLPAKLHFWRDTGEGELGAVALQALALEPSAPDWASGLRSCWQCGEADAHARLDAFLEQGLHGYAQRRDFPDQLATSQLSPYLRFGTLSPRQLWHAAAANAATYPTQHRDIDKFQAELGWREFSYHLLFFNPELATRNLHDKFDAMPWRTDAQSLRAWQKGKTGYPIVDAGMRQLWATGWMHNRVRMLVASFLIKHLLIDWRHGERWFWDTLVDADPANNAASWQWVAGCGADAAPYFRIFNPVIQGEKFDPDGSYVKRWIPELAHVPTSSIHRPWQLPTKVAAYPQPIIDHHLGRQRALSAYRELC